MEKTNFVEVNLKDWMEAVVFDADGRIKALHYGEDLITSDGKASVAALILNDVSEDDYDWIAIGSGSTAASTGDVGLDAEHVRAAATGTQQQTVVPDDTAQFVYIFASGKPSGLYGDSTGTKAIVESGLFNAAAGPTMLCRQTFGALNIDWNGGDSLQITWKIQVGST